MCGRIALITNDAKKIKTRFRLKRIPEGELKPRYNIPPSQPVAAVLNESPEELSYLQWGLVPNWAKEISTKYSMINAKAETVPETPAYRGPIRHKRCLIIVDTFYEWKRAGAQKRPFRFLMKDEGPFALAGLWDCWQKDGGDLRTCAIITTEANALMKPIHDRMPVIFTEEEEKAWLSDVDYKEAVKLLKPYEKKDLRAIEISTLVNSPSHNTEDILKPVR
jgi:putative SOS response-associated peptidase YedK